MKNKKGFTLLEIIISLTLIILIGTISIVSFNKFNKTPEEKEAEFIEKIKLEAEVYIDNNKHIPKFQNLRNVGDWAIIFLSDLIDEGLLDEKTLNPSENISVNEMRNECLKLLLNEDKKLDLIYRPDECKEQTREEIENGYYLKLDSNNSDDFELDLEPTDNVLDYLKMNDKTFNAEAALEAIEHFKRGQCYSFGGSGAHVEDFYGNVIDISEYDSEGNYVGIHTGQNYYNHKCTVEYYVNLDSSYYDKIVTEKSIKKEVTFKDVNGPVLIVNSFHEKYTSDTINLFLNTTNMGYVTSLWLGPVAYYSFDNNDGLKYFNIYDENTITALNNEKINGGYNERGIKLQDSSGNYGQSFKLEYEEIYSPSPIIEFDTSNIIYTKDLKIKDGDIFPIFDLIKVTDKDKDGNEYECKRIDYNANNNCEFDYYIFNKNKTYYRSEAKDDNFFDDLRAGEKYTLHIDAIDNDSNYSLSEFEIVFDEYYFSNNSDFSGDNCNVACQMYRNSLEWSNASEEERERLHYENQILSQSLPEGTYYSDDGYWRSSDGNAIYDPNQPCYDWWDY